MIRQLQVLLRYLNQKLGVLERPILIGPDPKQFMAWRRQNDKPASHLFPNRCGDRLMPPAFRKRLKLLCEDKSIAPHLTPHQFRHSAATLLIENEIDRFCRKVYADGRLTLGL